jgi:hypothetical protein
MTYLKKKNDYGDASGWAQTHLTTPQSSLAYKLRGKIQISNGPLALKTPIGISTLL